MVHRAYQKTPAGYAPGYNCILEIILRCAIVLTENVHVLETFATVFLSNENGNCTGFLDVTGDFERENSGLQYSKNPRTRVCIFPNQPAMDCFLLVGY